jgi:hypothetical protein
MSLLSGLSDVRQGDKTVALPTSLVQERARSVTVRGLPAKWRAAATWGKLGAITQSKNHSVQEPVALWFAASAGLLYIGSPGNQRIFTYPVPNVAGGNFQANSLMQDSKHLDKVSGITVDPTGNLYTCSRKTNEIYQWSASGSLIGTFAKGFSDSRRRSCRCMGGFRGEGD